MSAVKPAKPAATVTQSMVRKTYWLALEGCDPRPVPYSRQGRHYRPTRMRVERANGNVANVELLGAVLKKDGSEGQQATREPLFRRGDWPKWVASIVDGLA